MRKKPKAVCTVGLIIVNIAVFMVLSLLGDTENGYFMLHHGAMYEPMILENQEYYRFFTCMFLHFGIQHLLNNMVINPTILKSCGIEIPSFIHSSITPKEVRSPPTNTAEGGFSEPAIIFLANSWPDSIFSVPAYTWCGSGVRPYSDRACRYPSYLAWLVVDILGPLSMLIFRWPSLRRCMVARYPPWRLSTDTVS